MASSADRAHLTRVRDNQRRSRARRKEYMQELEQRLRDYEARGVEASTQVQQVARRVVEENKRLRTLLNQHGVTDDSINAFLRAPSSSGGLNVYSPTVADENEALSLEQLLAPRRTTNFLDVDFIGTTRRSSIVSMNTRRMSSVSPAGFATGPPSTTSQSPGLEIDFGELQFGQSLDSSQGGPNRVGPAQIHMIEPNAYYDQFIHSNQQHLASNFPVEVLPVSTSATQTMPYFSNETNVRPSPLASSRHVESGGFVASGPARGYDIGLATDGPSQYATAELEYDTEVMYQFLQSLVS